MGKVKIVLVVSVGQRGPEGMESVGAAHIEAVSCALPGTEFQSASKLSNFAFNCANLN